MIRSFGLAVLGGVLVVVLGVTFLLASVQRSDASTCLADPSTYPASGVSGYKGDQLANAAAIIGAAQQLSLGRDAQIIGVMTAMGESSLVNITYGDDINGVVNPDGTPTSSIGLFQQQDWWGSVEDRMNPTKAATMFFDRLNAVEGWQDMEPSHAIWRVQINSDKNHYAKYEDGATAIVDTLSGPCAGSGEWIVPARGTVSGTFGDSRGDHAHMGTDLADNTCGGPIWAASAGVVSSTGSNKGGGGYIWIEHADGVMTGYFHMKVVDFLVTEGQTVEAGDQIGKVGNEGNSFGCHLHYEVKVDGEYVNPQTFMEGVGVPLPL